MSFVSAAAGAFVCRGLGQSLGPVAPSTQGRSSPDSADPAGGGASATQEFLSETWNFWGDKVRLRIRLRVVCGICACSMRSYVYLHFTPER